MGVEAAVVEGVSNGDVSIQRDGAQVHDGRRGEQDVQIDPDGAKVRGQGPPIICRGGTEDGRKDREDRKSQTYAESGWIKVKLHIQLAHRK